MCGARRAANSRSSICSWCWHSQERFSYRSFSSKPRRMPSTSQAACTWARRTAERREPWSKRRAMTCHSASWPAEAVGNLGGDPDGADGSAFVQLYAVEGGKGGEIALVLKGEFDGGDLGGIA